MKKVLIVCATYYSNITNSLKVQAELALNKAKIKHESFEVPGVFEIPVVISKNIDMYDGFLALGCVIKGETPHFDFLCNSTFISLLGLSTKSNKPIGNGIITALNMNQAKKRSFSKGKEATKAILEVINND